MEPLPGDLCFEIVWTLRVAFELPSGLGNWLTSVPELDTGPDQKSPRSFAMPGRPQAKFRTTW